MCGFSFKYCLIFFSLLVYFLCRMRVYVDYDIDPSGKTCYVENVGHVEMLTFDEFKKEHDKKLQRAADAKEKKILQIQLLSVILYISTDSFHSTMGSRSKPALLLKLR